MQIDGKIAVLVTKERNGGGCSLEDVKKAYADLGFNDRQCRELLRHVKWLAKKATEDGSSATQQEEGK